MGLHKDGNWDYEREGQEKKTEYEVFKRIVEQAKQAAGGMQMSQNTVLLKAKVSRSVVLQRLFAANTLQKTGGAKKAANKK